jgi:hypothetical protein
VALESSSTLIHKAGDRHLTVPVSQRGKIAESAVSWENCMDNWKKAAVMGSIGAAALLFMKKKYPAGVLATGVGLALLASEYPEKFEKVRRSLPDYFDRGMQVMEMAAKAGKRITEAAGRSAVDAWEEIGG